MVLTSCFPPPSREGVCFKEIDLITFQHFCLVLKHYFWDAPDDLIQLHIGARTGSRLIFPVLEKHYFLWNHDRHLDHILCLLWLLRALRDSSSVRFSSVAQSCPTLCVPMDHSISSSNEHSGLTSFTRYWLDPLVVQGTLKSILQHHSSKASIFLALNFLCSPTLTSIHDHWKNHSFDQTDLCWQSNVSTF